MLEATSFSSYKDLQQLIDSQENIRLEFKSSKLFYEKDNGKPGRKDYAIPLTKAISGFANTEGGQIIIGLETDNSRNKPDTAISLDSGIPYSHISPESIQRSLESSISPPLAGLRFIPINSEDRDCFYLIIDVPKGNTAHQAKDRIYYGRSEFETKPLHDSVVRLLMTREINPHGQLLLENKKNKIKEYNERDEIVNEISFDIYLENDGEINITEFQLDFEIAPPFRGYLTRNYTLCDDIRDQSRNIRSKFDNYQKSFFFRDNWPPPVDSSHHIRNDPQNPIPGMESGSQFSLIIFPEVRFIINSNKFIYVQEKISKSDDEIIDDLIKVELKYEKESKRAETLGRERDEKYINNYSKIIFENARDSLRNSLLLSWKLFLPNTKPVTGSINLIEEFNLNKHIQ